MAQTPVGGGVGEALGGGDGFLVGDDVRRFVGFRVGGLVGCMCSDGRLVGPSIIEEGTVEGVALSVPPLLPFPTAGGVPLESLVDKPLVSSNRACSNSSCNGGHCRVAGAHISKV